MDGRCSVTREHPSHQETQTFKILNTIYYNSPYENVGAEVN